MAQQAEISKIEFIKKFSTVEACEQQLFKMKWPNGYKCEKCGCAHHYTTTTRKLKMYQCKECGYQATVTVNTVMEKTHTCLTKWFLAIYSTACDKRGISAAQLAKDIEVSYPTAWLMLHKIRSAMNEQDANYKLAGIVELDDAYFGGPGKNGKRGRGTDKTKVIVGLSLGDDGHPKFLKMEVIDDVKGATILDFAERQITENSTISSDAYNSYRALAQKYKHEPKKFNPIHDSDHLKWLHVIISNAKAFIEGTYHGLEKLHLQRYLDEFCYRFYRRKFVGQGFFRLLSCCALNSTITYNELT